LLPAWLVQRRRPAPAPRVRGGALAVGAGYLAGQVGVDARPPYPPREATDWLWYLTFAAVALGLLDAWKSCPSWLRWLLRSLLWLTAVWVLLPTASGPAAGRGERVAWLAGLGAAGLACWAALEAQARRLPGAALPLTWLVVAQGSGIVLYLGHSGKLAQFAGALAAALVPVLFRSGCRPALAPATLPVALLLPGLWLTGYFYAGAPAPSLALLAVASLAGGLGGVGVLRRLPSGPRAALGAAVASLLVAAAVLVARNASPAAGGGYNEGVWRRSFHAPDQGRPQGRSQ
jgi:hypothetical protein